MEDTDTKMLNFSNKSLKITPKISLEVTTEGYLLKKFFQIFKYTIFRIYKMRVQDTKSLDCYYTEVKYPAMIAFLSKLCN